ncbi:MAG: ATP-binding protein [Gammaproteobacteria bacterium]|nr:ATP-binding protein [Gammaproteobacteria bacterium]
MAVFERLLNLPHLLQQKSFFLFGPRATGKSFLIRQQLKETAVVLNLLNHDTFVQLSLSPHAIEKFVEKHKDFRYIVIDEVQKIPALLDEVHRLIEERQWRFLLTGSSARKLRRANVNLLAGRAWEARLFPLTSREIPNFNLSHYLLVGGLPAVYTAQKPDEELFAYVHTYLQEEIQAEALVRKLPAFTRFLYFAAMTNGDILNFAKMSSDVGVAAVTIREYYQVLEDTFIGFMMPAYARTSKRKAHSAGKFYFFDLGIRNVLASINSLSEKTDIYGQAFEHFIALEIRAYLSYKRLRLPLSYWQSMSGYEVDIIIGDKVAVEVKSSKEIRDRDFKTLRLFSEEQAVEKYYLVSRCEFPMREKNIDALYWEDFLNKLWAGEII